MKYIFLNHKMNFTQEEFQKYKEEFEHLHWNNLEVGIFPSFLNMKEALSRKYKLGSQNVSKYEEGSHTGEVSAKQLRSFHVSYTLVGHSERRKEQNEESNDLREKIKRLLEQNITPVLCIGEEEKNNRERTLKEQLSIIEKKDLEQLIIAYEPVYSIGTGVVLENQEIEEAIESIEAFLKENNYKRVPILYGGSVDETNIGRLKGIERLDGFLIGKASLNIEKIKKMMEELQ